ncbi:glutathione S-transferase [Syncephalis fuscata]|nr:glutathione S-transferase [Syncephalis fuscata]
MLLNYTFVLISSAGKYNGKDIEEAYEIDSFADLLVDFFKAWATSNWGDDAAKKTFAVEKEPRYLAGVERFLVKHNGPYILGNEPSYADFKLLSVLLDTKSDLSSYPHIKTFSEAIRSRPGVQKYLSTLA